MRVYEVAKLYNISNKELIELLAEQGFQIKSHMTALSDDMLTFLNKKFSKKTASKPEEEVISSSEPTKSKKIKFEPKLVPDESSIIEASKDSLVKNETFEQSAAKLVEHYPEEENVDLLGTTKEILIEPMTVSQLAEKLEVQASELILLLLKQGIVSPKNSLLNEKVIEQLLLQFGATPKKPLPIARKSATRVMAVTGQDERLPVVVVLGHVDHGKTTLLDFIRKSRIADREKGGITQHLGAYEAVTEHGNIVFIDTPGHEAFSNIRGRGVGVADIAVLVIAADDSVMPQTIEAIKKIKAAKIPVIVAVNKMDRVDHSRIEVVKNDLARYEILPEEWGGDAIFVPISGKTGMGVDKLLEMIVLQGQLMDLKTDRSKPAIGFILESKLEKGLGPVATLICQQGILRVGDLFNTGHAYGKVYSIVDSYGKRLKEVGPSVPVQIAGFSELAHAGEHFEVVDKEKYHAIKMVHKYDTVQSFRKSSSLESINLIVKTDNSSSKEALLEQLEKIFAKQKKELHLVYTGVGNITESDVTLAVDTGARILGLHVKIEPSAMLVAKKNLLHINQFNIIYKLLEFMQDLIKQKEKTKIVTQKIGEAVVRKVFPIKNLGVIAGSYVKEGRFARDGKIVAWRGRKKLGEGPIKSLERDRNSVKEVHAGYEFAFLVDGMEDWEVDDRVECYLEMPEKN